MSDKLKSMEQLKLNNGSGQSYGYIVYRTKMALKQGSVLSMRGHPRDLLLVMVNGVLVNDPIMSIPDLAKFGSWAVRCEISRSCRKFYSGPEIVKIHWPKS